MILIQRNKYFNFDDFIINYSIFYYSIFEKKYEI